MKHSVYIALACLILSSTGQSIAQTYTVEKLRDIPLLLDDDIVGSISDMVMDADGRFFLADDRQNTIWVAESSGTISRRLGREGAGPGELMRPGSVVVFEDKAVVLDTDNNRVSIFSKDGTYLSDFLIAPLLPPSGLMVSAGGQIAVSSVWDVPLFKVYDLTGTPVHEIGSLETGGKPIMPMRLNFHHVSRTPGGRILYSPVKRYEVFRVDWDGTILNTYSADPDGYSPLPEVPRPGQISFTPLFRPLYVNGHVLVQRMGKTKSGESNRYIDLFTVDGEAVQTGIELPMVFFFADGNELYGIDTSPVDEGEANPSIVVYRLAGG